MTIWLNPCSMTGAKCINYTDTQPRISHGTFISSSTTIAKNMKITRIIPGPIFCSLWENLALHRESMECNIFLAWTDLRTYNGMKWPQDIWLPDIPPYLLHLPGSVNQFACVFSISGLCLVYNSNTSELMSQCDDWIRPRGGQYWGPPRSTSTPQFTLLSHLNIAKQS